MVVEHGTSTEERSNEEIRMRRNYLALREIDRRWSWSSVRRTGWADMMVSLERGDLQRWIGQQASYVTLEDRTDVAMELKAPEA